MLSTDEMKKIASAYIERVTKGECDIFPEYLEIEDGIVFDYQSKEYLQGIKNAFLYGNHNSFIVDRKTGLIHHILGRSVSKKETIELFLAKKIKGIPID